MKNIKKIILFLSIILVLYICLLDKENFVFVKRIDTNKKYEMVTLNTFYKLIAPNNDLTTEEKKTALIQFDKLKDIFGLIRNDPGFINKRKNKDLRKQFHKFLDMGVFYETGNNETIQKNKDKNLLKNLTLMTHLKF